MLRSNPRQRTPKKNTSSRPNAWKNSPNCSPRREAQQSNAANNFLHKQTPSPYYSTSPSSGSSRSRSSQKSTSKSPRTPKSKSPRHEISKPVTKTGLIQDVELLGPPIINKASPMLKSSTPTRRPTLRSPTPRSQPRPDKINVNL